MKSCRRLRKSCSGGVDDGREVDEGNMKIIRGLVIKILLRQIMYVYICVYCIVCVYVLIYNVLFYK